MVHIRLVCGGGGGGNQILFLANVAIRVNGRREVVGVGFVSLGSSNVK